MYAYADIQKIRGEIMQAYVLCNRKGQFLKRIRWNTNECAFSDSVLGATFIEDLSDADETARLHDLEVKLVILEVK